MLYRGVLRRWGQGGCGSLVTEGSPAICRAANDASLLPVWVGL